MRDAEQEVQWGRLGQLRVWRAISHPSFKPSKSLAFLRLVAAMVRFFFCFRCMLNCFLVLVLEWKTWAPFREFFFRDSSSWVLELQSMLTFVSGELRSVCFGGSLCCWTTLWYFRAGLAKGVCWGCCIWCAGYRLEGRGSQQEDKAHSAQKRERVLEASSEGGLGWEELRDWAGQVFVFL